jgi:probable sporulation protein (polysaccharide deacetylase family)
MLGYRSKGVWNEYKTEPIRKVEVNSKKMAFTCNVDWGGEHIPKMLEIFKENNIKVTFFITGRWAEKNRELLVKIKEEGHEIGNHGYSHKLPTKTNKKENIKEIKRTEEAIYKALSHKTNLFAPPAGDYNKETLEIAENLGYKVILWSVDTIDWKKGSTKDIIIKRVFNKDHKGAILLMHPKEETIKALPHIIKKIKEEGIHICTVSELINI